MSVANFFSSNVKWIAIAGGGIVLSLFVGGLCCCVRKRRRARERKGRVRIPESDWNANLTGEEGNVTPPLEDRPDFNRSWRERGSDATEHSGGSWRSIPTVSSAEMSEHSLTAIAPPTPAYPSRASPQTSPRLPSEPRSSQARRVLRRPRSSANTLSMATPSQSSLGQATDASTTSTPLVDDSSSSTRPLLSVTTTPPTPPIPSPAIPAQNPPVARSISPPPYSFVEITPGMLAGGPPRRPEPRSHRALALAHALAAPQPLAPETPRSAMSVLPDYTSRASTPTPTVRDGNPGGAFSGY